MFVEDDVFIALEGVAEVCEDTPEIFVDQFTVDPISSDLTENPYCRRSVCNVVCEVTVGKAFERRSKGCLGVALYRFCPEFPRATDQRHRAD